MSDTAAACDDGNHCTTDSREPAVGGVDECELGQVGDDGKPIDCDDNDGNVGGCADADPLATACRPGGAALRDRAARADVHTDEA